ncbi:hypothetical protein RRG08_014317 [Elysia crispata]|uniref:Uncharacterized protein n=1 Tax=Elysia crispata TaxID=231223 RepID=A0AAE0Z368_9GAST|nr:hypothetical protein RRG08_014317 [Elysia crispata]
MARHQPLAPLSSVLEQMRRATEPPHRAPKNVQATLVTDSKKILDSGPALNLVPPHSAPVGVLVEQALSIGSWILDSIIRAEMTRRRDNRCAVVEEKKQESCRVVHACKTGSMRSFYIFDIIDLPGVTIDEDLRSGHTQVDKTSYRPTGTQLGGRITRWDQNLRVELNIASVLSRKIRSSTMENPAKS